jgi:small subunit ribosomal protein S8
MNPAYIDFLTRLKNATLAGSQSLVTPNSRYCLNLAELLQKYHFLESYAKTKDGIQISNPQISHLKFFSTPGHRLYQKASELPWGISHQSLIIVSTSSGLMSQKEAQKRHLGGEIIAEIY